MGIRVSLIFDVFSSQAIWQIEQGCVTCKKKESSEAISAHVANSFPAGFSVYEENSSWCFLYKKEENLINF